MRPNNFPLTVKHTPNMKKAFRGGFDIRSKITDSGAVFWMVLESGSYRTPDYFDPQEAADSACDYLDSWSHTDG